MSDTSDVCQRCSGISNDDLRHVDVHPVIDDDSRGASVRRCGDEVMSVVPGASDRDEHNATTDIRRVVRHVIDKKDGVVHLNQSGSFRDERSQWD